MSHAETHARMLGCFNKRDFAAIEEACAPGFMYEDLARAITIKTPHEFTEYLQGWVAAIPDGKSGSETYVGSTDTSVATFHARGHFDGVLGETPGNGRMLDLPMCEVLHYAADGRVLSGELYYDQLTMLGQLGLMSTEAAEAPTESPSAVVRAMMGEFDRLDIAAVRARMDKDVRGIDEISRAWIRDRAGMEAYFAGLEGSVTDVATTVFDLDEQIWGDTAVVTGWMEQDYQLQGTPVHVSSPMTVALRRDGESWKVALVHAIPLVEESG